MRSIGLTTLLLLAACGGSSTTAPAASQQPPATNSGVFAVVAVGDKLKAYVPESSFDADGHAYLLVVDAASPRNGASGYLGRVDLGVDGHADAVAAAPGVVVAVALSYPVIWFVDPATDRVVKQLALPDAYGSWLVSSANAFMTGVIIDAPQRRAFVSVWNGFLVLDLDARAIVDEIVVAPSENFAFDPQRGLIVAPFYQCPPADVGTSTPPPCQSYQSPDGTVITDGLNVVNLATGKVYTYVDEAAADQSAPAGFGPDAAAVDPTGGKVLVPSEGSFHTLVLDLDAGSAVFDDTTGTFTVLPAAKAILDTPPELTGVAIEPGSRLGIGTQEGGSTVLLYDLASVGAGSTVTAATFPNIPWSAGGFLGHRDPHGVRAGVSGGKPVAWLVNEERTWLVRVDLEKFHALALAQPGGIATADMERAVTFIYMYPAP